MKDQLGFKYTPTLFSKVKSKIGTERAIFRLKHRFPEYILNDSTTDGKVYTYPLVKTVLDGETIGGSKLNFQQDILNQKISLEKLILMVQQGKFDITKDAFCNLHDVAAKEEALEWGIFRTGSVGVAGAVYIPPPAHLLNSVFNKGITYIKSIDHTLERAIVFFLFGAYHQFFYDVNKRTSRLMMNGVLLAGGWDALIIDAKKRVEYNQCMLTLYNTKNADDIIKFLVNGYRFQDGKKLS